MQHPARPREPRQEIVDLAAGLVPGLAARAAGYDEADAFCHEDFDEMVAAGYTAITVPAELGGMGASALDLVAAQSRLAEGNPATALAVNMHLHGVGLLAEGFRDRVEPFLKQVATEGAILAGGFSEPQSGGNWWYQASTATPLPGGGYRLSGTKTFFTGWPRATHLFLTAAVETEAGREPIGFLVPRPERGVRVLGDWKAMGMRATGSNALAIDELEIPPECVVAMGFPMAVSFLVGSHWSWPSFASVFLGAAEAAFRHVTDGLPRRRNEGLGQSLADLPGVQQAVGRCACAWTRPGRPCWPRSPGRPTPTRWPTTAGWPGPSCSVARPPLRSAPWPCAPPAAAATCAPARWSGCCATPTPACSCPPPTTPPCSGWAGSSSGRQRPPGGRMRARRSPSTGPGRCRRRAV